MGRGFIATSVSLALLFACAPDDPGRHGAVRVMPPPDLTTSELGEQMVFQVRLDYEPTADVTIPLEAFPAEEGVVVPSELVFTPDNWIHAQSFVVRGVGDDDNDGVRKFTVMVGDVLSEDPIYSGLELVDYEIKNYDADVALEVFNPDEPDQEPNPIMFEDTLLEDGSFGPKGTQVAIRPTDEVRDGRTLTIRATLLNARVNGSFQASLDPVDDTDTVDLVFTAENWQEAQIVDVRSIDDEFAEAAGGEPELTFEIITDDPVYNFATLAALPLQQVDNEIPGITVSNVVNLIEGATGTITVALHTPPLGDVTIDFTSADVSDVEILGDAVITFTAESYAHTLDVRSIDNSFDDVAVRTVQVLTNVVATDPVYTDEDADDVDVNITDNDSSGGGGGPRQIPVDTTTSTDSFY